MALFRRSTGSAKPNRVFFLHSSTLTPVFSTKNHDHPHFVDAFAIWETRKYKLRSFEMGFQFITNSFGVFSAKKSSAMPMAQTNAIYLQILKETREGMAQTIPYTTANLFSTMIINQIMDQSTSILPCDIIKGPVH